MKKVKNYLYFAYYLRENMKSRNKVFKHVRQILIGIGKYKDIGYKGYEAVLPGHNIPV